jgi:hypothetical protein
MNKSRKMRWVGHIARMEETNNEYILVGKPGGKIALGRPRRRWINNIRMDVREVGSEGSGLDASGLGQGPEAGHCGHSNELWVP